MWRRIRAEADSLRESRRITPTGSVSKVEARPEKLGMEQASQQQPVAPMKLRLRRRMTVVNVDSEEQRSHFFMKRAMR